MARRARTRWTLVVVLAAAAGTGASGAGRDAVDPEAREVILRQFVAFRAGDYRAAYAFASQAIRARFDLHAFEQMVKTGYPQIARSTHAWVTEARVGSNGALHVFVRIRGADGTFIRALYEMVREEPGWRINGVVARPDPGTI